MISIRTTSSDRCRSPSVGASCGTPGSPRPAPPRSAERIRNGLRFFRNDADPPASGQHDNGLTELGRPTDRDNLRTVRDRLAHRISRLVGGPTTAEPEDISEPTWHGVRLDRLSLRRRQKFKLVVVLREPGSGNDISKEYGYSGKLRDNGLIKNESEERRITLPRVTGALAGLLTVLLVLTLAVAPAKTDPNIKCGSGDLSIRGSSVFMPTIRAIAADYMSECPQAHLDTKDNGSLDGVRAVSEHTADIALSDGRQHEGEGLHNQKLAIVVYAVVVNKSVGLVSLSAHQLRGIFINGTYTNWSQLPG
jgi:phosphate transport system substrate-binding protein